MKNRIIVIISVIAVILLFYTIYVINLLSQHIITIKRLECTAAPIHAMEIAKQMQYFGKETRVKVEDLMLVRGNHFALEMTVELPEKYTIVFVRHNKGYRDELVVEKDYLLITIPGMEAKMDEPYSYCIKPIWQFNKEDKELLFKIRKKMGWW
jgi:hypothetical protein